MKWQEYQKLQKVSQIGDRFISYVDQGDGIPLVFIHGIPTWGYLWNDLLKPLSKKFRVLIPDLMGFGFSDKSDCFDRSIAKQTEYLVQWLEKLGIKKAFIVGHDIGGGVALRIATLYPELVKGLSVMNCVSYDSWPIEMMIQTGHPLVYKKISSQALMTTMKFALKSGFATRVSTDLVESLLAPYRTEVGKLSLIRNAAALNTNLTTEITAKLSSITVPTLILWGTDDKFQDFKYAERLSRDIPNSHLIPIEKARHFVMLDQPEIVINELRRFFEPILSGLKIKTPIKQKRSPYENARV